MVSAPACCQKEKTSRVGRSRHIPKACMGFCWGVGLGSGRLGVCTWQQCARMWSTACFGCGIKTACPLLDFESWGVSQCIICLTTTTIPYHGAKLQPVTSCRCTQDGQYEQAIGIALESRRLDRLEQTITAAPDQIHLLAYSLDVCQRLIVSRDFRQEVRLPAALTIPSAEATLLLSLACRPSNIFWQPSACLDATQCRRDGYRWLRVQLSTPGYC